MSAQRGFVINNLEDLGKVHQSFELSNWLHVAVEDCDGRACILAEHENGNLYVTSGDEDGWVSAEFMVVHHGPITVLSEIVLVPETFEATR